MDLDMIIEITKYLEFEDVQCLLRINKEYFKLRNNNTIWKYLLVRDFNISDLYFNDANLEYYKIFHRNPKLAINKDNEWKVDFVISKQLKKKKRYDFSLKLQ